MALTGEIVDSGDGGEQFEQGQPSVPKFGSWDMDEGGMPYTVVFENARAGKRGTAAAPMTTDESISTSSLTDFYINYFENKNANMPSEKASVGDSGSVFPLPERRVGRQDMDSNTKQRHAHNASLAHHDRKGNKDGVVAYRPVSEIPPRPPHLHHESSVSSSKAEGSTLHARKASTTSSDGLSSSSDKGGRSRPRSSKGDTTPARVAVPKFGGWDENNAASGESFTTIFDNARAAKKIQTNQESSIPLPLPLPLPDASVQAGGDLYGGGPSQKPSKGFWSIICCRHVSA